MDKTLQESLARRLHRQRKTCLAEFKEAETALRSIAENRESEVEESAQEDRTARLLSRLDDRTLRAVEEIDAALERIRAGNYGRCQRCGKSIPIARLRSLPATRYCVRCAGKNQEVPAKSRERIGHKVESPGVGLSSDRELETAIHESLKEDGRLNTEELRIVCRQGVVYLYGALPSEKERQILLAILTDLLGLKEIVDRIGLDALLWERADRSKPEKPAQTLPWEEPRGTEDIVEMAEEGKEFSPPDRPLPDEE